MVSNKLKKHLGGGRFPPIPGAPRLMFRCAEPALPGLRYPSYAGSNNVGHWNCGPLNVGPSTLGQTKPGGTNAMLPGPVSVAVAANVGQVNGTLHGPSCGHGCRFTVAGVKKHGVICAGGTMQIGEHVGIVQVTPHIGTKGPSPATAGPAPTSKSMLAKANAIRSFTLIVNTLLS
jgi:hypothetical protein